MISRPCSTSPRLLELIESEIGVYGTALQGLNRQAGCAPRALKLAN
jgi:hypothetical protein